MPASGLPRERALCIVFFFQAEDGIRDADVTGVQTCALPIYGLTLDHPNLCVVGDPDQSIYKWRGSDIKNILDFERDFPDARVITLSQNYRSTKAILQAAGSLIDHNKQRKKKKLITDNPQGEPVRI